MNALLCTGSTESLLWKRLESVGSGQIEEGNAESAHRGRTDLLFRLLGCSVKPEAGGGGRARRKEKQQGAEALRFLPGQ